MRRLIHPTDPSLSVRSNKPRLSIGAILLSVMCASSAATAQSAPGLMSSRASLTDALASYEVAAAKGDVSTRAHNAMMASAIRQRLRDGDMKIGDRVVVTILSDALHRDTVVVSADRTIQLLGTVLVPLSGVLRSELQQAVESEVQKYVKAQEVTVTPLLRVGILGAVTRPGYFAFASDIPITDAIMGAGGPTGSADIQRSTVRRANQEFRSARETSSAISSGLTLDQLGLSPGDELVIGQRRDLGGGFILGLTGALASVLTLVVALHRR